jgi:hypothetical protein
MVSVVDIMQSLKAFALCISKCLEEFGDIHV